MHGHFVYRNGALYCEEIPLEAIAHSVGTPCYVYSASTILQNFNAYKESLQGINHQICYAVKANSNLAILNLLARHGSWFDIVSGGELYRVLRAGGAGGTVVFSGVGKTQAEMEMALEAGIHSFNCESEAELELLSFVAQKMGKVANVAIRVNPDVNAETHPYIATGLQEHKFGIDYNQAVQVYEKARRLSHLNVSGISCHIGSQILELTPFFAALERILELTRKLEELGFSLQTLDLGGGLGVAYRLSEEAPKIEDYAQGLKQRLQGSSLTLLLEPGRSIVGEAGVLLTKVLYLKTTPRKNFVIVDAGMNDLLRPALYGSHHEIVPICASDDRKLKADVVGPICESGDFLGLDRELPTVKPGDILAVCTAGAYGFVLSSNYNSRPRPAEVLVYKDYWTVVRKRETFDDLIRLECIADLPVKA